MNKAQTIHINWYAVIDIISAMLAWGIFFFLRKWILNEPFLLNSELQIDNNFWKGLFLIPLGWSILYALTGTYQHLYKKSRLLEFTKTFVVSLLGVTVIFFLILL